MKTCKLCFNNRKQKPASKLQHAATQAQSLPCTDLQVCQTAKLSSTIFETILSRTNPWNTVIDTIMYDDIAVSKRVDQTEP